MIRVRRQISPRWRSAPLSARPGGHRQSWVPACHAAMKRWSVLKLAFERLDFLCKRVVIADERLDLAHRMKNGGVVAPAETAADLGQRAQRQDLGEIHRHLK